MFRAVDVVPLDGGLFIKAREPLGSQPPIYLIYQAEPNPLAGTELLTYL